MTNKRAIELLKIERECVNRNNQPFGMNCNRECGKCDLLTNKDELIEMYDFVISKIKNFKGEEYGKYKNKGIGRIL